MPNLSRRPMRNLIGGIVLLSLVGFMVAEARHSSAQDKSQTSEDSKGENSSAPTKGSAAASRKFVVPANATIPQLAKFIAGIEKDRPEFDTETDAIKFLTNSRTAILEAADKILASKPTEDQEIDALKWKLGAYQLLLMVGSPEASAKGLKFAEELKHDKRPELAEMGQVAWFDFKMSTVPSLDAKERRALVDALADALRKKPQTYFKLADNFGRMLEALGDGENAAAAYQSYGEIFSHNLDEDIRGFGEVLKTGAVRRARLLTGEPVRVSGKTVDGKPFDISQYKGKVVIVDFWATWCGPCLAELPNLKKIYEKYHDRGLEIVGVNLDDDGEQLAKFLKDNDYPWKILHDSQTKKTDEKKRGFADPNAEFYGITGIPTIILIDRKGKVVSLDARGEQLATLVDGLVGGTGTAR
ncbi:MAG TPA: TlpA disulfide reductase family protein [Planctomycetaceae bacterium]|jgi:thiol-disulfide isomerase/thioredoxin|nr:TlpA disulfide reductase family protein [Planctomycetaceae bacterium]